MADSTETHDTAGTDESYAQRAMKSGPLPHVDDDSPFVGEDARPIDDDADDGDLPAGDGSAGDDQRIARGDSGVPPIMIPSPGAGAYPVPSAAHGDLEDEGRSDDAADDAPAR